MIINSERLKPRFQEIEIKLTIQSQRELDTIASVFGKTSPNSIKKAVEHHDEKAANNLDLSILSLFLSVMHDQLK